MSVSCAFVLEMGSSLLSCSPNDSRVPSPMIGAKVGIHVGCKVGSSVHVDAVFVYVGND